MTNEEKLKEEILKQYRSIRSFALDAGIPQSTLSTILIRGIGNTSVNTMIQICQHLGIDIQMFMPAYLKEDYLELYDALDTVDKAEVRGIMKQMLKNEKYKKE